MKKSLLGIAAGALFAGAAWGGVPAELEAEARAAAAKGAASFQSRPHRRQNSKAKIGRRRLPPPSRLYSTAL